MKKTLAINIDYIIRDWESALVNTYKRQIDEDWEEKLTDSNNLWKHFNFPSYVLSLDTTATDY